MNFPSKSIHFYLTERTDLASKIIALKRQTPPPSKTPGKPSAEVNRNKAELNELQNALTLLDDRYQSTLQLENQALKNVSTLNEEKETELWFKLLGEGAPSQGKGLDPKTLAKLQQHKLVQKQLKAYHNNVLNQLVALVPNTKWVKKLPTILPKQR
jgi:hypothetical protein